MEATTGSTGTRSPELEFSLTRYFDASRETVFRVLISPLLIPKWWGAGARTTTVDSMDVRPGGEWRFVQHDEAGEEYGFHGVYEEVEFPTRLSYTLEYEGEFSADRREILTFADAGEGRTQLTITDVFEASRARQDATDAGLLDDLAGSMERLAKLVGDREEEPSGQI